jgi:hypothetical protein
LWEANGPALGRVFGDLIHDKLPVIARSVATRRSQLREPSHRRLNEQVEAMAGSKVQNKVRRSFARAIQAKEDSGSSEVAEVRLCLTFASHNFRPSAEGA